MSAQHKNKTFETMTCNWGNCLLPQCSSDTFYYVLINQITTRLYTKKETELNHQGRNWVGTPKEWQGK